MGTRYPRLKEGLDGWTKWVRPDHEDYKLACCDCGLVHRMQFQVVNGQVEYRASRDMRATSQVRRKLK